ncbi:MAG: hypothetical protein HYY24_15345 [Verrucomicrobia bacterium]|nr:hypothetical protein [Verrucomicrobiota bacterium]
MNPAFHSSGDRQRENAPLSGTLTISLLTRSLIAATVRAMKSLFASLGVGLSVVVTWAAEPVPDFRLQDVNPNSVRRNTLVSPRDYGLQVSGYYFGAAS